MHRSDYIYKKDAMGHGIIRTGREYKIQERKAWKYTIEHLEKNSGRENDRMKPIYYRNKEQEVIVICGTGTQADKTAKQLAAANIKFSYFYHPDNKITGSEKYGKQILSTEQILELADKKIVKIVIPESVDEFYRNLLEENSLAEYICTVESLKVIQSEILCADQLVIWETGERQRAFASELEQNGKKDFVFCDRKGEGELMGKPVLSFSQVENTPLAYRMIFLKDKEEEKDIFDKVRFLELYTDEFYVPEKVYVHLCKWYGHELILYGNTRNLFLVKRGLEMFDIPVRDMITDNPLLEEYGVKNLYEIIYEDLSQVAIIDCNHADDFGKDVENFNMLMPDVKVYHFKNPYSLMKKDNLQNKKVLDPLVGRSIRDGRWHGIQILSEENIGKPIIFITGGSTSSSDLFLEKSWPEYLSEILEEKGFSYCIYNSASEGDRAYQEFIKLFRDGIALNPAMVITYDGANEMLREAQSEDFFYQGFHRTLFKRMATSSDTYVEWGNLDSYRDDFIRWRYYMKCMNGLCAEFSIPFYCFCQPILFNKPEPDDLEKNIILTLGYGDTRDEFLDSYRSFRKKAEEMSKENYGWYTDLSDVFDSESDVYIDHVHLLEKGNKIIAERIFNVIKPHLNSRK